MEPGLMTSPTNQILHDLLAQDPGAYWDPVTLQVAGSAFPAGASPRILRIPVHDPRIAVASGSAAVVVTKIAAFFMEQITGFAEVQGRFLRASGDGIVCAGGVPNAGFVITCATPARTTTWGHMKGLYR
jgi:hypothetical protein